MVTQMDGSSSTDEKGRTDNNQPSNCHVIKSENDKRLYKYISLENRIRILLVSDETTEKAAASVDVHVGHLLDPDNVPGIAHFCEHMLFLGTKKYPVENDFTQFLSQNGGSANAYTSEEHTNYHFDVKCDVLIGALDRFAQFFLGPCFNADSTDRELNAIDSEHQKNVLNDSQRMHFIDKSTSRAGHVFQKFGTGNMETLKTIPGEKNIDIRDLLLKFHEKYYSANIMTVVVLGKESLEELEQIVVPLFEGVVNKDVTIPVYEEHPYGENELGVMLNIATVKEMKTVKLQFPLPDLHAFYKANPTHCVSHLIGHEGEGSLLSLLKRKAWVNELFAGATSGAKGFQFFSIGMQLSEEGMNHIDDIIGMTFQYINMLRKEGPKDWVFQEMKMLDEMTFRFKDKEMPRSYVPSLSHQMHRYAAEDILYGSYRLDIFDPDLINSVINALTPKNFRYLVASQSFKGNTDKEVKYYNAEYSLTNIPSEKIDSWTNIGFHPELHLPHKNPFIPDSLDVKVPHVEESLKAVPTLIKDTNILRVWYKADDTFYLPKSCISLHICSPLSNISPFHVNQLTMFLSLLKDELVEYAYDAELAGVGYNVNATNMGILIQLSGYNSKQLVLLTKILQKLVSLEIKQDRFNVTKEKAEEGLRNVEASQPYLQIGKCAYYLLEEGVWNAEERLEYFSELTMESLKHYVSELLKNIYIECFFCGNLIMEDVNKITSTVEKILVDDSHSHAILPVQHLLSREYQLPNGCSYLFEKRNNIHTMSCIQVYMQVGLQEMITNVHCELFSQMLKEPCFDTLRTKEQLGYLVFSGLGRSVSVQGLKVLIQSDKPPSSVEDRIDTFLESFEETLVSMSDEMFKDYVEALAAKKLEKPKRLREEAGRYWSEIMTKQYHFSRAEFEVEELHKLTKNDIVEFYKTFISPASKDRKKMTIVILGKEAQSLLQDDISKNKTWCVVDDVLKLKSSLPLYPLMLPYNDVPLLASTKSKL